MLAFQLLIVLSILSIFLNKNIISEAQAAVPVAPAVPALVAAAVPVKIKVNGSKSVNGTKPKKPPVDLKSITVDSFQCSKRKLIMEMGKGGLGNKMWAILAGTVLALSLGRTLEIDWPDDVKQLKGVYSDFFVSPLIPKGETFNLTTQYENKDHKEVIYGHTRCNIDLTIKNDKNQGDSSWVMRKDSLFKKLDETCDNIRMKNNFDLSMLLLDPEHGAYSTTLKSKFPMPIHDVY